MQLGTNEQDPNARVLEIWSRFQLGTSSRYPALSISGCLTNRKHFIFWASNNGLLTSRSLDSKGLGSAGRTHLVQEDRSVCRQHIIYTFFCVAGAGLRWQRVNKVVQASFSSAMSSCCQMRYMIPPACSMSRH